MPPPLFKPNKKMEKNSQNKEAFYHSVNILCTWFHVLGYTTQALNLMTRAECPERDHEVSCHETHKHYRFIQTLEQLLFLFCSVHFLWKPGHLSQSFYCMSYVI